MSERVYLLNEEEIETLVGSTIKDLLEKTFADIAAEGSINLDTAGRVLHAVELRLAEETGVSFDGATGTAVFENPFEDEIPAVADNLSEDEEFEEAKLEVDKRTISQELKGLR